MTRAEYIHHLIVAVQLAPKNGFSWWDPYYLEKHFVRGDDYDAAIDVILGLVKEAPVRSDSAAERAYTLEVLNIWLKAARGT